jgi:hypothetical protein
VVVEVEVGEEVGGEVRVVVAWVGEVKEEGMEVGGEGRVGEGEGGMLVVRVVKG